MDDQRGFSILELCTVFLILGFITTFAVPAFSQFLMREERAIVLDRIKAAIEFAKQEAFARAKTITVCASINHRTCHANDWSAGFIILEMEEQLPHFPSKILYSFPKLQFHLIEDMSVYRFCCFGKVLQRTVVVRNLALS